MSERISVSKKFNVLTRSKFLWSVILLLILTAVTVIFVGENLCRASDNNAYEIRLFQDAKSFSGSASCSEKGTAKNTAGNKNVFDFQVADNESIWGRNTEISLFHDQYINKTKKVTVQGENNKKVIAPGTESSYTFIIRNFSKWKAHYQIRLCAAASIPIEKFPVEIRLLNEEGWVTGEKGNWKSFDAINAIAEKKTLNPGKSMEYTFYWRWKYDRDADEEDTLLGNALLNSITETSQMDSCTVTLHTTAVADGSGLNGENTEAAEHTETIIRKAVKTGDTTSIWKWILLMAAAGMVVVIVARRYLLLRKKYFVLFALLTGSVLCLSSVPEISGNLLSMPLGIGMANVLSGSMEPAFSAGTLVIVKKSKEIRENDIVVYQSGKNLVVHRVIDICNDLITTKGDANNAPDPSFDRSEIKGVVTGWIPHLGRILNIFHKCVRVVFTISLIFVLVRILFFVYEKKKMDDLFPRICAIIAGISILSIWLTGNIYARYITQVSDTEKGRTARFNIMENNTLENQQTFTLVPGEMEYLNLELENDSDVAVRYMLTIEVDGNLPLDIGIKDKNTTDESIRETDERWIIERKMPVNDTDQFRFALSLADADYMNSGGVAMIHMTVKTKQADD